MYRFMDCSINENCKNTDILSSTPVRKNSDIRFSTPVMSSPLHHQEVLSSTPFRTPKSVRGKKIPEVSERVLGKEFCFRFQIILKDQGFFYSILPNLCHFLMNFQFRRTFHTGHFEKTLKNQYDRNSEKIGTY